VRQTVWVRLLGVGGDGCAAEETMGEGGAVASGGDRGGRGRRLREKDRGELADAAWRMTQNKVGYLGSISGFHSSVTVERGWREL